MRAQAHTHTPAVTLNRRVQTLLPSTLNSSTVLTTSESSLLPNRLYRPIHPVTKKGSVRTTRRTLRVGKTIPELRPKQPNRFFYIDRSTFQLETNIFDFTVARVPAYIFRHVTDVT